MKLRLISLASIAALALLAACNQAGKTDKAAPATPAKPAVATIDGTPVSAEMFDLFVHSQTGKKTEELSPEQKKDALDGIVRLAVAAKAAEKDGLEKDSEMQAKLDLVRMNLLAEGLAQKYLKDKTATDQDLQAEYDKQVAAMPKQEFKARHILVADEDTAKKVIASLDKGAKFADLAKAQSQDSSKAQGGDLGWFSTGQMVKPFSDAVQSLEKGTYTKTPVQTQFGWHVILLEDSRPTVAPPFDAVKERLGPLVQQRKVRDYVDGLVKTAKVESKL